MDNEKPAIKLPRRKYYTIEELANYWRNELGIADAADSVVEHYVNEGLIKTSLRYEWPDGKGWFFEDYTARTHMINSCKQPPTEKCYMDVTGQLHGLQRITSAVSEGIDNKIKRLKRIAYGYRDVVYFLLKIHQHCGLLNPRRFN